MFDACAGVGPFAVPAAKAGALVIANDLNPDSFKWLQVNCEKAKKKGHKVECLNMDARDFIKGRVTEELIKLRKSDLETESKDEAANVRDIHITMNLPALAITFLDVFRGLFKECPEWREVSNTLLPKVHAYGFSKAENKAADIQERCEKYLGQKKSHEHCLLHAMKIQRLVLYAREEHNPLIQILLNEIKLNNLQPHHQSLLP